MISLLRIRQVGFLQLIVIVFFKLGYKFVLFKEKVYLYLGARFVYMKLPERLKMRLIQDNNTYNLFKKYCILSSEGLKEADLILQNRIPLYGKIYNREDGWLTDPLTGQKVDAYTFFADASVTINQDTDVKYVMELNKFYHLVVLACAYKYSGNEKYIYKIEEDIKSWTQEVKYELGIINKIIMDLAYRNLNLIYICILCKDNSYFKEKISSSILNIIYWQTLTIQKFATPKWFKTGNASNHTIGEMVGYIISALWLSRQLKGYKIRLKWALRYLNTTLRELITENGVYLEQSFNYSKLVFDFLFLLDIGMKDFEYTHPLYERKYFLRLSNYLSLLLRKDFSPNFGDNDSSRVILPFYYSNRYLNTIKYQQTSLYDVKSGQIIWHSEDGNDIHLFLRCGQFSTYKLGAAVHCHCDILALLLSVKGKRIFVDRGTSYYNRDISFRDTDRSSFAHNCISFDGLEQAQMNGKWAYSSYPSSQVEIMKCAKNFFHFVGHISYGKSVLKREIHYEANTFEITDTFENFFSQKCYLNYTLDASLVLRQERNNTFYISDNTADRICMILDERMNAAIGETEIFEVYSKGIKTQKITGHFFVKDSSCQVYKTIIRIL